MLRLQQKGSIHGSLLPSHAWRLEKRGGWAISCLPDCLPAIREDANKERERGYIAVKRIHPWQFISLLKPTRMENDQYTHKMYIIRRWVALICCYAYTDKDDTLKKMRNTHV